VLACILINDHRRVSTLKFRGAPRLANRLHRLVHTSVPFARSVRLAPLRRWWMVRCIFLHIPPCPSEVCSMCPMCRMCAFPMERYGCWQGWCWPSKRVDATKVHGPVPVHSDRTHCRSTFNPVKITQTQWGDSSIKLLYLPSPLTSMLLFQAS